MYIKVKVKTGQKREEFKEKSKDTFLISVKERAERNMANKKIIGLVARRFKISTGQVKIIKGHQEPSKILDIKI